jgi:hypothetical protein
MADLWDLYINVPNQRLDLWMKIISPFIYKKEMAFFDILVPTIDTTRFSYVMQKFMEINKPVLFIGATGIYRFEDLYLYLMLPSIYYHLYIFFIYLLY